jgi:predicted flavoprotein YhiN
MRARGKNIRRYNKYNKFLESKNIIIATGGKSYPLTGSTETEILLRKHGS